jgi:hypothetical protein
MSDLRVPDPLRAEEEVAGVTVSNPAGALGLDLVVPADFYHPHLGRLAGLRQDLRNIQFVDDRIAQAAEMGYVDITEVRRLVSASSRMFDVQVFARRIAEAARARRAMTLAADVHNRLGAGVPLDEVRELLLEAAS